MAYGLARCDRSKLCFWLDDREEFMGRGGEEDGVAECWVWGEEEWEEGGEGYEEFHYWGYVGSSVAEKN